MKHIEDLIKVPGRDAEDIWILVSDEASDPMLTEITRGQIVSQAAVLVKGSRISVVVNEMEAGNLDLQSAGAYVDIEMYEGSGGYSSALIRTIGSMGGAKQVLLNYSADPECDFLPHGLYLKTADIVGQAINDARIVSADALIKNFYERKTHAEAERISLACRRAVEIIEEAFLRTSIGDTELDIHNRFHSAAEHQPKWFSEYGVVGQEFAWEKSLCPIILVGENLQKGAHSSPSNTAVKQGDTLYCDFGVKLVFCDGETWSSDLQRMAVIGGNSEATAHAKRIFEVLYSSVSKAAEIMKPNVSISEIDRAARSEITAHGFPDYVHATGHAIGSEPHGIGETIRPEAEGSLTLGGTYTVEPRIKIPNGGSIEEVVWVTEEGGRFLSERQTEIIVIN